MAGAIAFQEKYMGVNALDDTDFSNWNARRLRYQINWAMYENSAYRKMHVWSAAYKTNYGLYRYIRNIYNPSYRLGEFYKAHLWGGRLDPDAGDGSNIPSALPIVTDNPAIRPAIALLWQWSNWQVKKDVNTLKGTVFGDAVIKVVDDPEHEKVYLYGVNPATLKTVDLDPFGNVKGYEIVEERTDPRKSDNPTKVLYREVCNREGDDVVYQTFLDKDLYAWDNDGVAVWTIPYGFVPMVVVQHNDAGFSWGWSELYPGMSKFREVDDLASKLSDQIRKMVDAPALLSGVSKPKDTPQTSTEGRKLLSDPEGGREEIPALYAPAGSNYIPMVSSLSIKDAADYIKDILKSIEEEYPELSDNLHNVQGDISGRALRINREPVEDKIAERRARYDNALTRAQMMALSIGGFRKYEGFGSFSLDSFKKGALDHSIGVRPGFRKDPADDLDQESVFWDVALKARNFGMSPAQWLKRQGWEQKDIDEFVNSEEYKAKLAGLQAAQQFGNAVSKPVSVNDPFGKKKQDDKKQANQKPVPGKDNANAGSKPN
jgi:hypothetical protein